MSLSVEIAKFLLVSAIYIGFAFVWGWYKGREENEEEEPEHSEAVERGERA
ncbi:hypothetical protein [Halegenticoccus tardaugens]|uniref:hypothetical protein n=1 Tax=Halegenticoccus tardaugens TaxID=2071624 RepID=UPI0013E939C4|nr:hypothetical protein [Halegenticoccus tardaugens]